MEIYIYRYFSLKDAGRQCPFGYSIYQEKEVLIGREKLPENWLGKMAIFNIGFHRKNPVFFCRLEKD